MNLEREDVVDLLKQVGGPWGWMVAFGIVGVLGGLSVLLFTNSELVVMAVAFGAWLIFSDTFRFVGAFAIPNEASWMRALWALLAIFSVVAGVSLLRHPYLSLVLLAFTVGIFCTFHGLLNLSVGIALPGEAGLLSASISASPQAGSGSLFLASRSCRLR